MDWEKLKIFHEVVKAGNFSRASKTLSQTQSSLSRYIQQLERELNVVLFRRHARGLDLTEQGEILFESTKDVGTKVLRAEALVADSLNKPQGEIKVATTVAFGSTWLVSVVHEFLEKYNDVKINIHLTDQNLDHVIRDVDCIIRFGSSRHQDLIQRCLIKTNYHVCVSKEYVNNFGQPDTLEDLQKHRLIANTDLILKLAFNDDPSKESEPVLRVNSVRGVLEGVLSGIGIGIVPSYVAVEHKNLIRLFKELHLPGLNCFFAYPAELKHSKRINIFRDFLIEKTKLLSDSPL